MEFVFRHFKVIRLHEILDYVAGAVRTHSGQNLGYCYIIVRGPKSCLLGQLTGLLCSFQVKRFLPSIFKCVDFLSSVSDILLHIEFADMNVLENWEFFSMGLFRDFRFVLQKKCKPRKQVF